MTLPTRNLDDRKFQEIVDEARKRINASCPEWTDHNVSDPGITLVELFAWMTEMILYRLNQVPEKNYIKLLELLGLELEPPEAAHTMLTFYLSAALSVTSSQLPRLVIPTGTEAATVRTETRPSVIFSTDEDLVLNPPKLSSLFTREAATSDQDKPKDHDHPLLQLGLAKFEAFYNPPNQENALYLGFENDLSYHVVALDFTCEKATNQGINPKNPPWEWEGWFGQADQRWVPAELEEDTTGGFSESGRIVMRLPRLAQREIRGQTLYWLRCRVVKAETGRNYDRSPVIMNLTTETVGGTVRASNASVVHNEELGRSDGAPGQLFRVEHAPLLRRIPGETIEILPTGATEWEPWHEVQNFADSDKNDKVFTCNSADGEIRFAPALRLPDRNAKSFGAVPPRGAKIRFNSYRYGGGVAGNVQRGSLVVPKTSIPYMKGTNNHRDAIGGVDPETIERLQLRAPTLLHTRERAVTSADFQTLARRADHRVKRAHCVQSAAAGQVFVLLVPSVNFPEGRIEPEQLHLPDDLVEAVSKYLDERRLLTVQIGIREAEYAWIEVDLSVKSDPNVDPLRVQAELERRLYKFLNPIVGGHYGAGWEFGRSLYTSDVYSCLQGVNGVLYIESLDMYRVLTAPAGKTKGDRIEIPVQALIASAEHKVRVTPLANK